MSRITAKTVSGVAADVLRMTLPQQEDFLDRIHESQPHILLTIDLYVDAYQNRN